MPAHADERARQAAEAGEEELGSYIHDRSPDVIKALLLNNNVREQDVLIIANRKNLPGEIFESIAKNKRWTENYPIRLALAKNLKTPLFVALSISRYLHLFDLVEISRSPSLPLVYRHKIENMIIEKIPIMPLGIKKSLAKKAAAHVLSALLRDKDLEVVRACLDNPHCIESHLVKVITRGDPAIQIIRMISHHPKWSSRYSIRLSLMRNNRTPLAESIQFLRDIKTTDLKEFYADTSVPPEIKPYVHSELMERGEEVRIDQFIDDRVYEISEEESREEVTEKQDGENREEN